LTRASETFSKNKKVSIAVIASATMVGVATIARRYFTPVAMPADAKGKTSSSAPTAAKPDAKAPVAAAAPATKEQLEKALARLLVRLGTLRANLLDSQTSKPREIPQWNASIIKTEAYIARLNAELAPAPQQPASLSDQAIGMLPTWAQLGATNFVSDVLERREELNEEQRKNAVSL
jgi:hypothetical protein